MHHHTAVLVARDATPETRRTVLAVAEGCLMPQPAGVEDSSDSIIAKNCDNLEDLASVVAQEGCDWWFRPKTRLDLLLFEKPRRVLALFLSHSDVDFRCKCLQIV